MSTHLSRAVLFLLVLLAAPLATGLASAAPGDHVWSAGYESSAVATVDGTGHVASAGNFYGAIDWGGGPLTTANPDGALFLARHDGNGAFVWNLAFEPSGYVTIDRIAADEAGRIFVVGTLYGAGPSNPGSIDFGGGPLTGSNDFYVAGFDAAGSHLFSRVVGAGFPQDVFARAGRVVVTGYTYASVDFGGGSVGGAGGSDAFVGCLTSGGAHAWSAAFGDGADQGGMAVALDGAGRTLLAMTTSSAVDLGGGLLTPTASVGLCLARFDATGAHEWSRIASGQFNSGAGILADLDLDVSADGRVLLGGQMNGTCDFGGGMLTSNGGGDAFVAVYDASGGHKWSSNHGGPITDKVGGVAFDPDGNVVLVGSFFSSSIDFGGGAMNASPSPPDLFLAVMDPDGAHLLSDSFGSDFGVFVADTGVLPSGAIFLTGAAASNLDLGGGPLANASHFRGVLEGFASTSTTAPSARWTQLEQNAPNPFNPITTIRYRVEQAGSVRVEIHDLAGRHVRTLFRGAVEAGTHEVRWNGHDDAGHAVAGGVYVYRLVTERGTWARRMTLVE